MHDAEVVRRFERVRNLTRDVKGFIRWQRPLLNAIREGRPFDELHDERHAAVGFFEAVYRGDIRVVQRRQDLGLATKARQAIGIRGHRRRENLDRDGALQAAVRGLVNLAHAAGADLANHFVGAEAGTCAEHRGHEYTRLSQLLRCRGRSLIDIYATPANADLGIVRDLPYFSEASS